MDVIGLDDVPTVSWQKSARVGYTKALIAAQAYWISYKRRSGAVYQPTDSDALEFKKDEINASLRDVVPWREAMVAKNPDMKSKHNTEDRVAFQGATLYIRGGKSARSYRRLTLDFVEYDELDGFDHDIEREGAPTALGDNRLAQSPYPKSIRGSTPKARGESQIERSMAEADLVFRRWIPCPHCGHMHPLEWKNFRYEKSDLDACGFDCPSCRARFGYERYSHADRSGVWTSDDGRWIDEEALRLRDQAGDVVPWPRHCGFFLWAAYSYVQSWPRLAGLWVEANEEKGRTGDTVLLKTFVNTQLAETWTEQGVTILPEVLYSRREAYAAEVPAGALVLVMGVDTQDDRLELEVVGFAPDGESWGIAYKELIGSPAEDDVWRQLDAEIDRVYEGEDGNRYRVIAACVDSGGHHTKRVYEYCRTRWTRKVYAVKGQGGEGVPMTRAPTKQRVQAGRTCKLYSLGVDAIKGKLWSLLDRKAGQPGVQHFPEAYGELYFEQLTAEQYVRKFERGKRVHYWQQLRARNEALDCRVYAMAALELLNPRWDLLAGESDAEDKPAPQPRRRARSSFVKR